MYARPAVGSTSTVARGEAQIHGLPEGALHEIDHEKLRAATHVTGRREQQRAVQADLQVVTERFVELDRGRGHR
jgi:hypothetical protein